MFSDKLDKNLINNLLNCKKNIESYKNIPSRVPNYNIVRDDDHNNDYLITWDIFRHRPNKITIFSEFETNSLWNIINENFKVEDIDINKTSEVVPEDGKFIYNIKYFIRLDINMYITFVEFDSDEINECLCSNISIYYNPKYISNSDINNYLSMFQKSIIISDIIDDDYSNILKINLNNEFEILPMSNDVIDINIDMDNVDLYYEFDLYKSIKKMSKSIEINNKGLTVLYGDRGLGKTEYATMLIKKIKKKVIYVPSNILEYSINNIDFIQFIKSNKNSVLLIDDAEIYFNKINKASNILLNNLLQLVDSIISDSINVNIILILNSKRHLIDDNLFNCNNLLNCLKFDTLSSDKVKELNKFLKKSELKNINTKNNTFGY